VLCSSCGLADTSAKVSKTYVTDCEYVRQFLNEEKVNKIQISLTLIGNALNNEITVTVQWNRTGNVCHIGPQATEIRCKLEDRSSFKHFSAPLLQPYDFFKLIQRSKNTEIFNTSRAQLNCQWPAGAEKDAVHPMDLAAEDQQQLT
jgi:hypothetical protein